MQGAVPGDGVVPLVSAHLEGAEQLTLKCYHSISPSQDKWQQLRGSWYGSDSVRPRTSETPWGHFFLHLKIMHHT